VQLDRLINRDECSREDALSRLNSQIPITDKIAYADQVLDNSGSMAQLEEQVDVLVRGLEKEVGWTWLLSWLLPPIGVLSAAWALVSRALKRRTDTSKKLV
jgi:dephospho-CoA kinase